MKLLEELEKVQKVLSDFLTDNSEELIARDLYSDVSDAENSLGYVSDALKEETDANAESA